MKVNRAAQVLSHTVQAALLTYICSGDITLEAFHTATFIKHMNTLFDIFNSSCLFDAKPFRCALKDGAHRLTIVK